jgi:hypothetical protein
MQLTKDETYNVHHVYARPAVMSRLFGKQCFRINLLFFADQKNLSILIVIFCVAS